MARVLVAGGDPVERDLLANLLVGGGHEALAAADGDEALAAAERERPEVILADLLLPRRDALTLILHLRARDTTAAIPVVIVSAEPFEEHGLAALDLGAAAYIEKPWSASEMLDVIRKAAT